MGFRTKLDFSDNRQVKQRIETTTVLSGGTTFGVTFSQLPSGPNYAMSSVTQTLPTTSAFTGTFSGNNTTSVYTWPDSRLYLADSTLSAWTPSNSGVTQQTNAVFTADTSSLFTVDGNSGYGLYTGITYTAYLYDFIGLGGGNYSGTVQYSNVQLLEAPGLDYSGRTIWADVSGITRTERLIITDNPMSGYVWTCINSEGMGEWQYNGSSSGSTIWTAGTGSGSAVLGGSNGIASGAKSVAEGNTSTASGTSSHAEGYFTIAGGPNSHAEGESSIASGSASHVEGSSTIASGQTSHAEGKSTVAGGEASHAEGRSTQALGDYSHAEGRNTEALNFSSHAEGGYYDDGISLYVGNISSGQSSHSQGVLTIAGGDMSHAGGYNSSAYNFNGFVHSNLSTIDQYSDESAILGGSGSSITTSIYSGIFAGKNNIINNSSFYGWGTLIGGENNTVNGDSNYFTIIGGGNSTINDTNAAIITSENSSINNSLDYSAILGGTNNTMDSTIYTGPANTIMAGGNNNLYFNTDFFSDNQSVMLGGAEMTIYGLTSYNNMITSNQSTISGASEYNSMISSDNCLIRNGYESGLFLSEQSRLRNVYQSFMIGGFQSIISGTGSNVTSAFILGGENHTISGSGGNADYSAIINGSTNRVSQSRNAIIIGGSNVGISGGSNQSVAILAKDSWIENASINSGLFSTEVSYINNSNASTIMGGTTHRIVNNGNSAVLGGSINIISASTLTLGYNTIVGGLYNRVFDGERATIVGGYSNVIYENNYAGIFAGYQNEISGGTYDGNTILGGTLNHISASTYSSINGGRENLMHLAYYSAIVGGRNNIITAETDELTFPTSSGIFAGANNKIIPRFGVAGTGYSASYCAIVGGYGNTISGHSYSFIGGGADNLIACDALYNAIIAGQSNTNHAANGVIIGGTSNTLGYSTTCPSTADNSIILGGNFNKIAVTSNNTHNTAIIGGEANVIDNTLGDVDNTVIIGGSYITANTSDMVYVPDLTIDGLINVTDLQTNANGKLVSGTSDKRLKQNINELTNSLDIVKNLRGVSFEYTPESEMGAGIRYGFIAQEVQQHVPHIVRNRAKGDGMLSLNYNEIVPLLVEAVKELATGVTTSNNTHLETQTVLAEDNNIELNFNGNATTAIGGGLRVLHAKGQDNASELVTDNDGNFVTNNDFKPNALTIPIYTPTSSNDTAGNEGNITRDDNYLYVKTSSGWKRTNLESF